MLKFLPNCHFFSGFLRLTCGLILGLALSLPSHSAQADFLNGTELQVYCTSQNPTDDAICIVYITGAVDAFTTLDLIAEKTTDAPRMFCLPDDIGPDQLRDVTLAWIKRPDTNLEFAATLLVWGAIKDAYSCS